MSKNGRKDASNASMHSKTSDVKGKEGHKAGTISSNKVGRHSTAHKTMEDFREKISSTATITIQIKRKAPTETPLLGKVGYIVSVENAVLGILLTSPKGRSCCSTYERDENDPLHYYLVSPNGEEIMAVRGLDDRLDLDNVVLISTGAPRTKGGKVIYGYPGADGDALSKATTLAGRDDTFVVPTSVLDENGDLIYIFRTDPENSAYTEILSADGQAFTIAEVFVTYKQKHGSQPISQESEGVPYHFTLNFIETIPVNEKILVIGVAIALFNQWLTRQERKNNCLRCTII